MTTETIPWYTFPILYGVGFLHIALAIPLIRRRIKPNGLYGVRFPSTMEDESVWYDMNERGGRHMVGISVVYMALLTVAWVFGQGWSLEVRFLVPLGVLAVALVCDAVFLGVASSRLLKQRRAMK
jgi:hypothetical protein